MTNRPDFSSRALEIVLVTVLFAPTFVAAQSSGGARNAVTKTAKKDTKSPASAKGGTTPRAPDGQPDLQGDWTSESFGPLERPPKYAGGEVLTDQDAEGVQKAGVQRDYDRSLC